MEIDLSTEQLGPDGKPLDKVREYLKCKMSPLYFVENYIKIPVAGGYIPVRESDLWWSTPKYRQFLAGVNKLDAVALMASRQHGKTTTILMYLLWAMMFYPKLKIEYVTLDAKRANDAVSRMNEMISQLPSWLVVPRKGKSEKVTYLELENGSRMNSGYVSGSVDPDKLGRGMSAPIIYIDETAFIPKMETVWAAMQPAISAARVFAKKNNYPTNIIFTTTPNGAGENYFYNIWARAFESTEVFEENSIGLIEDYKDVLASDPNKNNFVKFKIHWSETGKGEDWYNQQVRELNFNMRKVNQELNLVFLGSDNSVFDDKILEAFNPAPTVSELTMAMGEKFNLFEELVPGNRYLLGVDVAASTAAKADWSAMVLTEAQSGRVVGEWHGKFSVIKRFAMVVKSLIRGLNTIHGLTDDDLIVIIERNSFGLGVVEEMLYDDQEFDYASFLFWTKMKNDTVPGMQTNAQRREKMFNLLLSMINEHPDNATGVLIQEELRNLEQKNNGKFEAALGTHDDVIMAYNFTLFVRDEMIQEGTIVENGQVNRLDGQRINYYLDVSLGSAGVMDKDYSDFQQHVVIDHDAEKKRQNQKYDPLPTFDNSIIML